MGSYIMRVRNHLHKITLLLQILDDSFPCLITLHPGVPAALFVDGRVVVHNIDLRQVMTLPDFEIIWVMGRRDLNRTGSEFLVYIIICHDRNLSVHKRQKRFLSYDILVSVVVRMYGNGGISKHRLRTGCRNLKELICSHDRILDMPEESVLLLMLNLRIRQGSLTYRTPVDDPGTLIDISLLIEPDKYFLYRLRASFIHSEPFSVPVTGYSQLLKLLLDGPRILFLPLPGPL